MKRILISVFCVLPFLFFGCAKKEEPKPEKVQTVSGVKIETVKSSSQEEIYEAVGTVRSKTTSVISARVMGNILAIHVREGERVKTGQLLIEIDDRESAAQAAQSPGRGARSGGHASGSGEKYQSRRSGQKRGRSQ